MRFSKDDENDRAFRQGIKPGTEESGLTCVRADDQIISAPILEQVETHLKSARFVIIKVDVDNLNVFFELGYAMGLKKQFLLVSDDKLSDRLPTNISDWECLTYKRGDYEGLKHKVTNFLKSLL